jgi:hypothetical protein
MKRRRLLVWLALVAATTVFVNDASGMVVLGGAAAGLGLLLLPKARRLFGMPLLVVLIAGGPALNYAIEAAWARLGTDGDATPETVAGWMAAGLPWLQLRINARLSAMTPAEKVEVVALLTARDKEPRRSLRAFEIDAVPVALARGVSEQSVARLCARHVPEIAEAVHAAKLAPNTGIRPGHSACARFVLK